MISAIEMENNKLIAQLWLEFITEGDVESICRITAPGWIMHGGLPGLPAGPAGIRKLFASFGTVEQQWVIEDVIAEGSKVVVRAFNVCKQENFVSRADQAITQIFSAMFIHRIVNGMVVETWRNADDLGRVLQLGARVARGELN